MVIEVVKMVVSSVAMSGVRTSTVVSSVADLESSSRFHVVGVPDFEAMVEWRICWAHLNRKMRDAGIFRIRNYYFNIENNLMN